jgi:cytochrome P450
VSTTGVSEHPIDEALTDILGSRPQAMADPFPTWDRLREEVPVHRFGPRVLVSRHADVRALIRNKASLSSRAFIEGSQAEAIFTSLTEEQQRAHLEVSAFESNYLSRSDGDAHTRLRNVAHRAFTPRRVAELREVIARRTRDLLDDMVGEAEIDIVSHLAYRLPLMIIMEMLEVPPADQSAIHEWSSALGRNRGADDPGALMDAHRAMGEFRAYVEEVVLPARRGAEPESNLVAALMQAEQGDRLSPDELTAMFVILLFAGHETTTNLIANGLLTLLRDPAAWRMLREEPDVVPNAVEELLRFVSPVQWVLRVATADVDVDGARLAAGETVFLLLAAANRDPRAFASPDRLDLQRRDARDHLAFGFGPHFCIGNALARMEGAAVFAELARRFPDMRLATEELSWRGNAKLRSLAALPVHPGPYREAAR